MIHRNKERLQNEKSPEDLISEDFQGFYVFVALAGQFSNQLLVDLEAFSNLPE